MTILRTALAEYDGKHSCLLEAVRSALDPCAELLDEAIELAADADHRLANGATWILRAWIEDDASITASQVLRLATRLSKIADPFACLHICQTIRSLRISKASAAAFAQFLEAHRKSNRPFLRAWATDGLCHLGNQRSQYQPAAKQALDAADLDPAASVRARARNIRKAAQRDA